MNSMRLTSAAATLEVLLELPLYLLGDAQVIEGIKRFCLVIVTFSDFYNALQWLWSLEELILSNGVWSQLFHKDIDPCWTVLVSLAGFGFVF